MGKINSVKKLTDNKFVNLYGVYSSGIGFIEPGIAIDLVKVINVQVVPRTFVFNDVIFAEYSSNIFL